MLPVAAKREQRRAMEWRRLSAQTEISNNNSEASTGAKENVMTIDRARRQIETRSDHKIET